MAGRGAPEVRRRLRTAWSRTLGRRGSSSWIVVEDLTVADAAKLVVTDYQVNERKSLTDALGRIKHLVAYFGGMKLSQVTTATIKAYIKHRRSEERIVSRERTILNADGTVTVVPEVRRKPSNAQINRETTVLGRMFSLARTTRSSTGRTSRNRRNPRSRGKGF